MKKFAILLVIDLIISQTTVPFYQFLHNKHKEHYYTTNPNPKGDWKPQGIAFYAYTEQAPATVPIYQFLHKKHKDHFLTKNASPKGDWKPQGIAFYAYAEQASWTVPFHRFYSTKFKDHYYTKKPNPKGDWKKQGIEFYAYDIKPLWKEDFELFLNGSWESFLEKEGTFNITFDNENAFIYDTEFFNIDIININYDSNHQKIIKLEKEDPMRLINLGNWYLEKGLLDEAIMHYREVFRLIDNSPKDNIKKSGFLLLNNVMNYDEITMSNPDEGELQLKRIVLSDELNKKIAKAKKESEKEDKEVAIEDVVANAHLNLAIAYGKKGWLEEALREAKKSCEINPTDECKEQITIFEKEFSEQKSNNLNSDKLYNGEVVTNKEFSEQKSNNLNSDKLYNGEVVTNYDTGEKLYQGTYENGLLVKYSFLNKDGSVKDPVNAEFLLDRGGLKYEINGLRPYTGEAFELYDNGTKKLSKIIRDGKEEYFFYWYDNGQKKREGSWKDGNKDGLWIYWHENGQKEYEGVYKDGNKDGLWTTWFEDGQKWSEGIWTYSFMDGQKVSYTIDTMECLRKVHDIRGGVTIILEADEKGSVHSQFYGETYSINYWGINTNKTVYINYDNGSGDGTRIYKIDGCDLKSSY